MLYILYGTKVLTHYHIFRLLSMCFRHEAPEHEPFILHHTVNAGQQFSDGSADIQGCGREGQEESREEG